MTVGFIKLTCPNCGANIDIDDKKEIAFCTYCGTKLVQDKLIIEHTGKVSVAGIADENSLLERAALFIEEKNWDLADCYCNKILDLNAHCSKAYALKLLIDYQVKSLEELKKVDYPLDKNENYQKIIRFGDTDFANIFIRINTYIIDNIENNRKIRIYENARKDMQTANNYVLYHAVAQEFALIKGYKDAEKLSEECERLALEAKQLHEKNRKKNRIIKISIAIIFIILIIILYNIK